ncbi:MAG: NACHT domain-containing protein [Cyanobacteria bacterium P01_A01_bin.123]
MQKISKAILSKVDDELKEILLQDKKNRFLTLILHLDTGNISQEVQYKDSIDPKNYKSRKAYREAAISRQTELINHSIGKTKDKIKEFSIELAGGQTSNVVTARGTVEQFRKVLTLPGIIKGKLDEDIIIDQTHQHKVIDRLSNLIQELLEFQGLNEDEQIIHGGAKKFVESYESRYGSLSVLGMSDARPLSSVYTDIEVCDVGNFLQKSSVKKLSHTFLNRMPMPRGEGESTSAFSFFKENKHMIIFGDAGSGKSIFLKMIALGSIRKLNENNSYSVPLFLDLKKLSNDTPDIVRVIAKEFRAVGIRCALEFSSAALRLGKLIIILDGLDEVSESNLQVVKDNIRQLVENYMHNRIIISCRAAAYQAVENIECIDNFSKARIVDFDNKKVLKFIRKWFNSEEHISEKTADNCFNLLQRPENANARELSRTPLFLTYLCLIYDYYRDFPENRVFLYKQALHILLKEWPAEKSAKSQGIFKKLELHMEETLLAEIAFESFKSNHLFATKNSLNGQIQEFIDSNRNSPLNLTSNSVLKELTTTQGILVEHSTESGEVIYLFSHLTFQEYLVAKFVHESYGFKKLVKDSLTNKRWRSVFPLVSGLMLFNPGADEMIRCILDETKTLAKIDKLTSLLSWASEKCSHHSRENYAGLKERTFLLKCALDYLVVEEKNQDLKKNINSSIYWSQHWPYEARFPYETELSSDFVILRSIVDLLVTVSEIARDGISNNKLHLSRISEIERTLSLALDRTKTLQKELRQHRNQKIKNAMQSIHHMSKEQVQRSTHISIFREAKLHDILPGLENLTITLPSSQRPVSESEKTLRRRHLVEYIDMASNSLKQICIELFDLPKHITSISLEESVHIEQYFYANYILSLCIKAASRVSTKIVEEVRAKMITVC